MTQMRGGVIVKIFVAGATGVVGRLLVPLLVAAGHTVSGTTRRPERAEAIRRSGATPVVLDVLDADAVRAALAEQRPDAVIHQLTDLSARDFAANSRLRIDGTANLVDAARAAGVRTMVAQSIAWLYRPGDGPAAEDEPLDPNARGYEGVAALEAAVATMPTGVVLRYGLLYGPGTWYPTARDIDEHIRAGDFAENAVGPAWLHVDDAARAAVQALEWPAGTVNLVDDEPVQPGRPVSTARAKALGWKPRHPTWRAGLTA